MFCQYVLLFVAAASVRRVTCSEPAVIAHLNSEYVLDGREKEVKVQRFTGSDSQYWVKQSVGDGKYYIRNMETCKVLDVDGHSLTAKAKVITSKKNLFERYKQYWEINSDDTIVTAFSDNLVLDIPDYDVQPGVEMIIFPKNGGSNQKFRFENRTL